MASDDFLRKGHSLIHLPVSKTRETNMKRYKSKNNPVHICFKKIKPDYLLPTKLARDESRSLPRPLLADIAGLGGTIETGAGCPDGAMVGIRRSPKPSNTENQTDQVQKF